MKHIAITAMNLPPLPIPSLPALPPGQPKITPLPALPAITPPCLPRPEALPKLAPLAPRVIQVSTGDDFVQVRCKQADDAAARVEFIALGVDFVGRSMVPVSGTLHVFASIVGDDYVYRWRK